MSELILEDPRAKIRSRRTFLSSLIRFGYFPKEVPPPFTTQDLAHLVTTDAKTNQTYSTLFEDSPQRSKCVGHMMARNDASPRRLSIPNPANYVHLCRIIDADKQELFEHANSSPISSSCPVDHRPLLRGRALGPRWPGDFVPQRRMKTRVGAKYLLYTDVLNFYPSVYTHAIPWALHGKEKAKKDRSAALLGNRLDKALRDLQDGQTIGLPIGPDASFLLAEILLSSVDRDLGDSALSAHRWFDDYEFPCQSESEAEELGAKLTRALSAFELQRNNNKTSVRRLPVPLRDSWVRTLRNLKLGDTAGQQREDLNDLFDVAFEEAARNPSAGVLKYACRKLYGYQAGTQIKTHRGIDHSNWQHAQNLLLHCAGSRADTLPTVLGVLGFYACEGLPIDSRALQACLCQIVLTNSARDHSSEVAWALWGLIEFGIAVPQEVSNRAAIIEDDVSSSLLLLGHEVGLVQAGSGTDAALALAKTATFNSEHWLLAYEAYKRGWVPKGESVCAQDDVARILAEGGVDFLGAVGPPGQTAKHVLGTPDWMLGFFYE